MLCRCALSAPADCSQRAMACSCNKRSALSAARSGGVQLPCWAMAGSVVAISVLIAASIFQSSAAMAAFIFCPSASSVRCLSMFGLNAKPALLDCRQQGNDFIDDGRVEVDAGAVQAPGTIVVQAAEVGDDLATVVIVERTRQAVDDFGALVQADRLEFVALVHDVRARASSSSRPSVSTSTSSTGDARAVCASRLTAW